MASTVVTRVARADIGAKARLAAGLRQVHLEAGGPSYRALRRRGFDFSPATITRVLNGDTVPKWNFVAGFLSLCGVDELEIRQVWNPRWAEVRGSTGRAASLSADLDLGGTRQQAGTGAPAAGAECEICGAWVVN